MGKHAQPSRRSSSRHFRAALIGGAILAAGLVGGTVSSFTDSATSDIDITAGTIDLYVNSGGSDSKTVTLPQMSPFGPGNSDTRTFLLKNTGSLPMAVDLSTARHLGTATFLDRLTGTVTVDGLEVYTGPLSGAAFNDVLIAANSDVTVGVTVEWIEGPDDNSWAGVYVTARMTFAAESV